MDSALPGVEQNQTRSGLLRRIHHAAIICSDYAASKRFYTDVIGAKAILEAQGVTVEEVRTDEYTLQKFVFFADPDGLPLELYERK